MHFPFFSFHGMITNQCRVTLCICRTLWLLICAFDLRNRQAVSGDYQSLCCEVKFFCVSLAHVTVLYVKSDLLTFRILEWLQTSWLWRGGRSPPNAASSLFWKPSWNSSNSPSATEPLRATCCLWATTTGRDRPRTDQSGSRIIVRSGSSSNADPSRVSGRGECAGFTNGWRGGRGANHSASTCYWRLRDWGMHLPVGCWWGLRVGGGKRRRSRNVQGHRRGLLLRASAADLQTEGTCVWAVQPNCQHQHQHRRPHGVIHGVNNQQTQGDMTQVLP